MDIDQAKLKAILPNTIERDGLDRVLAYLDRFGSAGYQWLVDYERACSNGQLERLDSVPRYNLRKPEIFSHVAPAEPSGAGVVDVVPHQQPEGEAWPQTVKVWSELAFAAIPAKKTGGIRAWFYARALDLARHKGTGKVPKGEFLDYLEAMGLPERSRFRWLSQGFTLGIFRDGGEWIYYVKPADVARSLGVIRNGYPATLPAHVLTRPNWRGYVLAAFRALKQRQPISQSKIEAMTGVSPRCQRNWLNGRHWQTKNGESWSKPIEGITRRKNYAKGYFKRDQAAGLRESWNYHVFVADKTDGMLRQRLPDQLLVDPALSEPCGRGRARKNQKLLNSWYMVITGSDNNDRFFFDGDQGKATQALNNNAKRHPDKPHDRFILQQAYADRTNWLTIPLPADSIQVDIG